MLKLPNSLSDFPAGFKPFLASQFLGALNDNTFKIIVSLFVAEAFMRQQGVSYLCLTQIFFALPYVIFASWAGTFADRYSKSFSLKTFKFIEIIIMGAAAVCFAFGYLKTLLFLLFLMGLQSTLISPCKYGIMPELLKTKQLSKGNGILEFLTFMAIIIGTGLGSWLKAFSGGALLIPGLGVVVIAVIGFCSSLKIPTQSAKNSKATFARKPFFDLWQSFQMVRADRSLWLVFISIAFFWFLGSYVQLSAFVYVASLTGDNYDLMSGVFLTCLALGIGIGSIGAGIVSRGKVELGLVPIGMAGMSLASLTLALVGGYFPLGLVAGFFIGIFAGMFIVPLDAYLQEKSPENVRGRFIAASNFLSFSAVILGALLLWFLVEVLGFSGRGLFALIGMASACFTVFAVKTMPEMLVRCLNWIVSNIIYRTKVVGLENLPEVGGALIVCNHVSYADASLILASAKRPVRFLIYKPIYEKPLVKFFASAVQAIPIDSEASPKETISALKKAREMVQAGDLVCIFAEGALTRVGNLLSFNRGLERIVKGLEQPIIPACLDQLWGSVFSYSGGKIVRKWPKEFPYKVTLAFAEPMKATSKVWEVRQKVQELAAELAIARQSEAEQLQFRFLSEVRKHPFRPCLSDSSGKQLNCFQTLSAALLVSKRISERVEPEMVAVLLPPGIAGVIANLAALFAGKVPVNLNYTASADALDSAMKQCKIDTIISSKEFLEKIPGELSESRLAEVLEAKELLSNFSMFEKFLAGVNGLLLPSCYLQKKYGFTEPANQALATVIFSSGSTGEPKGVQLSHANIGSNLESLYSVFQVGRKDCLMGSLPLFHAFGFTGTFWLPLLSGVKASYHPNPLDAAKIGEIIEAEKASIFMSTPTFLTAYLRRCKPEQLKSLKYVIVGAEKLSPRLAASFEKRFGVTPMEGYGATELSPVSVMNVPDFEQGKSKQTGNKLGTVGHPLPGVAVRTVGIEDGKPLAPNQDGLLLVKGPNVMKGYLNNPKKTAEVIEDGWYKTGDIGTIDEDGFVTITDRLSRFSKIAGEMVPHIKIEEAICSVLELTPGGETRCSVTAVPDEKKGEKLVVLFTAKIDVEKTISGLSKQGLPNLWIPRKDCFFVVDEIPLLASGKTDLKGIKEKAKELVRT